jgi:PhzF family phenazine biosynthesis protein
MNMKLTLYQVDAFTDKLFCGNPAAVIPLTNWIDDELMQQIAVENNLSETAFFVPLAESEQKADYHIRWFTPGAEINLCGHATLGSAWVLFNLLGHTKPHITFNSMSGLLHVKKESKYLAMDFPSWMPEMVREFDEYTSLQKALGDKEIVAVYKNRDLIVELNKEEDVKNCQPDFGLLKKLGYKLIITAPGHEVDFVSRFFAPTLGIDEDPVTGSAHSQLIPFWSRKLGKTSMKAKQLSKRGGELWCEQKGERVMMGGNCVYYMKGEIVV